MADLTVDPSQVHTIEVDPSKVSAAPAGFAEAFKKPQGSAAGRAAGGFWSNTVGGLKDTAVGLTDLLGQYMGGKVFVDPNSAGGKMMLGLVQAHIDQAQKAKAALDEGRYSEAVGHSLATAIPMIGPAAAHAAERMGGSAPTYDKYGNVVKQGEAPDIAGGLGEAGGLLTSVAAPSIVKAVRPLLPESVRIGPAVTSSLNPVAQSAVDFLKSRDVELPVGTQTGNKFVKSAEAVTRHSPLGAEAAEEAASRTEAGLRRTAGNLADEASRVPATPESAGRSVKMALDKNIEGLGIESDAAYKEAWAGRDNPAHTESVPVRIRQIPELDGAGKPTGRMTSEPTNAPVNMPVDVRQIKEALQPVWGEMQWMPASDRASSAGYQAVKNILEGDDFIPAWQAEKGLSGLKNMSRVTTQSGVRNVSQGIGASIIPALQESVDAAVAKTGDAAIRGLQNGRALHASKMEVADIADQLRDEPVQNFGKLTWQKDTGIGFLRKINAQAPDVMPRVGRAYIDQLFDQATREGGFSRARSILSQWENLGSETKALLYPDPRLRASLDKFFKGAEMVGQTPNPSGTALVNSAASLNPLRWFAGYAGSKLLFSPRGAAILTDGLKIPLGGPRAAFAESSLKRLAAEEAAAGAVGSAEARKQ